MVGLLLPIVVTDTQPQIPHLSQCIKKDTGEIFMGTPAGFVPDSVAQPIEAPPVHTPISPKTNTDPPIEKQFIGEIAAPHAETSDTLKQTLKQFVTDTLTALHLLPKVDSTVIIAQNALTIYPSPVPRGTSFHLSWQTGPGTYQVTLFNISGALIQERILQVGSASQVDEWNLPTGLPAGIYIIRAVQPGQNKVYSQKLLVE